MRFQLLAIPWMLLLTQCGGQGPEAATAPRRVTPLTAPPEARTGLNAFLVAQVPPGTQGPVVAQQGDTALAVWVVQTSSGWHFQSASMQPQLGKVAPGVDLGSAPDNIELLFLRALDTTASLLAYTHLDKNGGHQLTTELLDRQGRALSEPVALSASGEALLWLDVVPSAKGPLVFWASSRGDRADVRAAALDTKGAVRSAAHDVSSDLRAWQVAPGPQGAALATVRATSNKPSGPVSLLLLDDAGMPTHPAVAVTQNDTAELDLDVACFGDNFVLAWTDRQMGDSRLQAAAVSASGKLTIGPHPLTPPFGDQSLIKLSHAPHAAHGYVFWENLLSPDSVRRVQISTIDDKGQLLSARASVSYGATLERAPEISVTDHGLAIIAPVSAAALRDANAPKNINLAFDGEEPSSVPTLVSLTEQLQVKGIVPLLLDSKPSVPNLTWGLHCDGARCFALAALSSESQAAVLGVSVSENARASLSLASGTAASKVPAGFDNFDAKLRSYLVTIPDPKQRPRLSAVRVIADSDPLADLAVSNGDVPLIASLTYFDSESPRSPLTQSAADGRRDPLQARIDVRGPLGEATSDRSYVSLRARSEGGLAWAVSPDGKDKMLAWSALDQGQPRVFVTAFGAQGKKHAQRMLTHSKANIADVAAATASNGYFVGWIDDQGQKSQAYLLQVSPNLERKGVERAIAPNASGKTGLQLLNAHNELWAVWSDTQDASKNRADIFLRRFAPSDGHPLSNDQRLFETPEHSHSPVLAAGESDVVVAWMESEPRGDSPEGSASVRLARLDPEGKPGSMRAVQSPRGQITAFGFDCLKAVCHLVVSVDTGGIGQMEGAVVDPRANTLIETKPLIKSLGPADESVFPVVAGNDAYWVDHATAKRVRIMRAAIDW